MTRDDMRPTPRRDVARCRSRRWLTGFVATAALAAAVAGCGGGGGSSASSGSNASTGGDGGPITLGVIASLSGTVGPQGSKFANGAKLAADAINGEGGIKALGGRPLKLEVIDDKSDPAAARQAALDLITHQHVPALVGPYGSAVCLAVAPVAQQMTTPSICSATDDAVTAQGYQYTFNLGTLGSTYVQAELRFLSAVNAQGLGNERIHKVGILYEDGPFGTNIAKQAKKYAQAAGFEIVAPLSFKSGDPNLAPLVNREKGAGAQALIFGAFASDEVNLLKAMQTAGAAGVAPVLNITGGAINSSVSQLGQPAEGAIGMSNWAADVDTPENQEFVSSYKKRFGDEPSGDSASGWTAVQTLRAALEEAGSLEPAAIRDAMVNLQLQLKITPQYVVDYDKSGLMVNQKQSVLADELVHGKFVTVWPQAVAAAKYVTPETLLAGGK